MAVGGSELAPHMGQRKTKPPLCSRNNADWMPLNFMPCRVLGCPAGLRASCPPGCPPRATLRPFSKQRCPIREPMSLRGLAAAQIAAAVGSPPSRKCTRGGDSRCAPPRDGLCFCLSSSAIPVHYCCQLHLYCRFSAFVSSCRPHSACPYAARFPRCLDSSTFSGHA